MNQRRAFLRRLPLAIGAVGAAIVGRDVPKQPIGKQTIEVRIDGKALGRQLVEQMQKDMAERGIA